jgi:hypothetical protein
MMTSDKPRKSLLYLMPRSGVEIHVDDAFICTLSMLYTTVRSVSGRSAIEDWTTLMEHTSFLLCVKPCGPSPALAAFPSVSRDLSLLHGSSSVLLYDLLTFRSPSYNCIVLASHAKPKSKTINAFRQLRGDIIFMLLKEVKL